MKHLSYLNFIQTFDELHSKTIKLMDISVNLLTYNYLFHHLFLKANYKYIINYVPNYRF